MLGFGLKPPSAKQPHAPASITPRLTIVFEEAVPIGKARAQSGDVTRWQKKMFQPGPARGRNGRDANKSAYL
jgi:hypothetical protein